MTYHKRIGRRRIQRSNIDLMISGAAMINIDQEMRIARKLDLDNGIQRDWTAVYRDIANAIKDLKLESEAA